MFPNPLAWQSWFISRDEIIFAELIALAGVIIWACALLWLITSDVMRSRAHRHDHPHHPRKHFHLHRR